MAVPGTVLGGTVVAELSDGTVVSVVDTDESRPIRRDRPEGGGQRDDDDDPDPDVLLAGAAATLLALQLGQPSLAVRLLSFPLVGAHGGGRLSTGTTGPAVALVGLS